MSISPARKRTSGYDGQLREQLRKTIASIDEATAIRNQIPVASDEFMKVHNKLVELRVTKATIESRLANIGNHTAHLFNNITIAK